MYTSSFQKESYINSIDSIRRRGLPTRIVKFRLSPDAEEKLRELFNFYGITSDSDTDAFREFIDKLHEKLILYKKSTESETPQSDKEPSLEELTCELRILENGEYFCVNRPPKMTKLATLQICQVCRALFYKLPTKAMAPPKEETETNDIPAPVTPAESQEMLRDPKRPFDKYGMVYCSRSVGMWVYPSKCKTCKDVYCPQYPNLRKEGESVGA